MQLNYNLFFTAPGSLLLRASTSWTIFIRIVLLKALLFPKPTGDSGEQTTESYYNISETFLFLNGISSMFFGTGILAHKKFYN